MICSYCGTNVEEWLNKFRDQPKIYLDSLYFEESKIPYRYDEKGMFISGKAFCDYELKKALERCPKCGAKKN